jgi:hypothetical protein
VLEDERKKFKILFGETAKGTEKRERKEHAKKPATACGVRAKGIWFESSSNDQLRLRRL